ncbi:MAG: HAMP domain-containing protein [Deltaproteobacteria bacterium]|nr:HAMP domain-containing protein [Deltaproteobacteria bacterium]
MRKTLWLRLLAVSLVIFFIGTGFQAFFSYKKSRAAIEREFRYRGEEITRALILEAVPYYRDQDVGRLLALLQRFEASEAVLGVGAYDAEKQVWLESSVFTFSKEDQDLTEIITGALDKIGHRNFDTAEGEPVTEFIEAVMDESRQVPLGWLRLVMERSSFQRRLLELIRSIFITSSLLVLVASLFYVLLIKHSLKTVPVMMKGISEMAAGNLDVAVPVGTEDELGKLASSFNRMAGDLKRSLQREKALAAEAAALEVERKRAKELEEAYGKLRDTQAQLMQAEKMGALGQLAGGIAHELNNPLTGILELLRVLTRRRGAGDPEGKFLVAMKDAAEHASRIVQDLKLFARPSVGEPGPVNINELLEKTMSFGVHDLHSKGITITKKYSSDLRSVVADGGQLQQVFLNMMTNARDAIQDKKEGKKELVIETRNVDNSVEVNFTDSGCGMPDAVVGRIFEPFFSTKGVGKGTGLGLSISHGIIEKCGGEIKVISKEGEGTTFKVILPMAGNKTGSSSQV